MRVLIVGSNGQLGREMQKQFAEQQIEFKAFDVPDIDITNQESINQVLQSNDFDTVVNCAAYTNVDGAESDYDTAYKINALGSKYLALACAMRDLELVHVSTDYVFSGDGIVENGKRRAYVETDVCEPNTAYGRTKLAGEHLISENCNKYYILRTAWLYGDGNNFVRTMLKLAKDRDELSVVNDQFGSPTSTVDLASAVISLLGSGNYGLYHATCEGVCTWYDFAKKIFEIKGLDIKVNAVTSEEFKRPAPRPKWSVLDNADLKRLGISKFRRWEASLKEYLNSYTE